MTVRWWKHQGGWGFISCGACRGQRSWRTWSVVLDISKCSIQRCAVARICQYIWTCCMYRAKAPFLISFGCLWWVCACALFRSFTVLGKILELNKCVEENVKTFPLDSCHYVWSLCKTNYWLAQMFLLLYRPEIVFQWCVWTNNLYTTFSYCCAVNILCPKENICLCIKMQICLHCSPVRYALRKRVCCCRHLFLFFFSCECAESKVLWDCGEQRVLFVDSRRTDFVCVNCAATGPICRLILIWINIHVHLSCVGFRLFSGPWSGGSLMNQVL